MIEFLYDGSFEGLLTTIFYAYPLKEPCIIINSKSYTPSLISNIREIKTEEDKFKRVYKSITEKINTFTLKNIYYLYLSEIPGFENIMLNYLRLCYKFGPNINLAKNNDIIILIDKYYRRVSLEAHRFKGFIRFKEISPLSFYASIEPDYNILPIIMNHFTKRFSDQNFIIHDLKREIAIVYNKSEAIITKLSIEESLSISKITDDSSFEKLWKIFYNSTTIEERRNPKLHSQFMPKRYWKHITEI